MPALTCVRTEDAVVVSFHDICFGSEQLAEIESEFADACQIVAAEAKRELIIDLFETPAMGSCTISMLIELAKRMRAIGADLRLANLDPDSKESLEMLKFDELIQFDNGGSEGTGNLVPRPVSPPSLDGYA